jgi:hypothetical protein
MTALNWRLLAAVSLATLIAAPATAQATDDRIAEATDMLADPTTQDRVARAMQAMSRAILAMPVGPMADAVREIDPDAAMADLPPNARLADLMGDDAATMPGEMAAQSRTMMRMMSVLGRQMAVMAPVLRDMAREMGAQMGREIRDARRGN